MGVFLIKETATGVKIDLKAANGQVIATSEVYITNDACRNGIASVIKNAPVAYLEDQTVENFARKKHPKFELYQDKAEKFRFRLKAANGKVIAISEGYTVKASCLGGVESVRKNVIDAAIEVLCSR